MFFMFFFIREAKKKKNSPHKRNIVVYCNGRGYIVWGCTYCTIHAKCKQHIRNIT